MPTLLTGPGVMRSGGSWRHWLGQRLTTCDTFTTDQEDKLMTINEDSNKVMNSQVQGLHAGGGDA